MLKLYNNERELFKSSWVIIKVFQAMRKSEPGKKMIIVADVSQNLHVEEQPDESPYRKSI